MNDMLECIYKNAEKLLEYKLNLINYIKKMSEKSIELALTLDLDNFYLEYNIKGFCGKISFLNISDALTEKMDKDFNEISFDYVAETVYKLILNDMPRRIFS